MTRAERETARLLDMIREAGVPVPVGASFYRVRASAEQRNVGAWAWALVGPDGAFLGIGSQWPRRTLLGYGITAYRDRCGDWNIDPQVTT